MPTVMAGSVRARMMPVAPRPMPVMPATLRTGQILSMPAMSASVGSIPMTPVPVMATPAGAMAVPSARVMRRPMVSPPVMSMPMMPVPVMRGVDLRARGDHGGQGDKECQAGYEESEESIP